MHPDEIHMDSFTREHVGPHGAFTHRTNERHVELSRAAVAYRIGIPVGAISIDWEAVRDKQPVKLRRLAA